MKDMQTKKVVCIGGGIGTVNLLKGIKNYTKEVSVILSMADDGGSAGRLRRLYNILPPGDLVSAMAALTSSKDGIIQNLLTYRFPGQRYGKDYDLSGHKLGNLIMVALRDLTGDFESAIEIFQKLFHIDGLFLPATLDPVSISAVTTYGKEIMGEERIDLGNFRGRKDYEKVMLHPQDVKLNPKARFVLESADLIIAGPGDLYSTVLPALIIKEVAEFLKNTKAKKIFVVNVTNQPEETKGYTVGSYIEAIRKHLGTFPFEYVIANDNFSVPIDAGIRNRYVALKGAVPQSTTLIAANVISAQNPLAHDSSKLAKCIFELI